MVMISSGCLQKQAMLVRQLEEELRIRTLQNPSHEVRQQVEVMYSENDHLSREVAILRETVKVSRFSLFHTPISINKYIMKVVMQESYDTE